MKTKSVAAIALFVVGFINLAYGAREGSIREIKASVHFCMTDFEKGLLTDIAQQIYGDNFFKYNQSEYGNHGFENGYRTSIPSIFWGDTNWHWGTNPNPRYISINSITHQFVSFYHASQILIPEIHFLAEEKIQSISLVNGLPTLTYQVLSLSQRDGFGREIVNSEQVLITGVKGRIKNESFLYKWKTVMIDLVGYYACLKEKLSF